MIKPQIPLKFEYPYILDATGNVFLELHDNCFNYTDLTEADENELGEWLTVTLTEAFDQMRTDGELAALDHFAN